jgi:epoxide hydrolase-like predicted phosphatase
MLNEHQAPWRAQWKRNNRIVKTGECMISTLIFDLGNVFVEVHHEQIATNLKQQINNHFTPDDIKRFIATSSAAKGYELGQLTSDAFYRAFVDELRIDIPKNNLKQCWQDIFVGIDDMIALLPQLKAHYSLAMISDTNPWHIQFIGERYEIFKHFNELIFSYEVHLAKPDPRIFQLALERIKSAPEACVYIDDLERNVLAARQLGIHAIQFKNITALKSQLSELGVRL